MALLQEVGIPDPATRAWSLSAPAERRHATAGHDRDRAGAEPELLIADEPTTALDVTVQAQILEVLDRLREARGMAVLLITHDLGIVAGRADRVAVMYAGQIVEEAATARLFAQSLPSLHPGLFASMPTHRRAAGPAHPDSAGPCRPRPPGPPGAGSIPAVPQAMPTSANRAAAASPWARITRMRCWLAEDARTA